jgi:hypothetical protein
MGQDAGCAGVRAGWQRCCRLKLSALGNLFRAVARVNGLEMIVKGAL